MQWDVIPADRHADDDFDSQDRIRVHSFEGWESGISYLSDVASWYALNDVRQGYGFRIDGSCLKGPRALDYESVEFSLEPSPAVPDLLRHLRDTWGPEGAALPPFGDPDVVRTAHVA